MTMITSFRRSNSESDNDGGGTKQRRRWSLFRRADNSRRVPFFGTYDMRIAAVCINIFNMGFIVFLLIARVLGFANEWPHLVPSILLSLVGIVGALRVNLTLTYLSTVGFAVLLLIYFLMSYYEGLITSALIIITQMLLVCEMMDGVVTKQDDALLSKEGQEAIKAVQSFASDV